MIDEKRKPIANQFTIRSIFVITIIMAVGSAGAGQLWRAVNGKIEDVGPFVIITSMAPLGVTVAVYWLMRLVRKI